MKTTASSKTALIGAMLIFGTIGIVRRYLPIPSALLALFRGGIGTLFLILFVMITGKKISFSAIKRNAGILLLSGFLVGMNWMLLFEAYRYTTVATATLCYYMAPIFAIILSAVFLKEKVTSVKVISFVLSFVGMVMISGIFRFGAGPAGDRYGILYGLGAAVMYAIIMVLNQKLTDINAYDRTIVQLSCATVVMIPYTFFTEGLSDIKWSGVVIVLLLLAGILHTGIAYVLYFGSMKNLPTQTVALYGYIDPMLAIVLSCLVLREHMGVIEIVGAVLILCGTMISELKPFSFKAGRRKER